VPTHEGVGDKTLEDAPSWRLATGFNAQWRHWGDEHILFHLPSGDTHLLDSSSAMVLHELDVAPCSAGDLARRLVASKLCDDDEARLMVEMLVDELWRLGLIEPER
jgi:PqqD family protein of HPr-rel-A system